MKRMLAGLLGATFLVAVIAGVVSHLVGELRSGRGLDFHTLGRGFRFNAIGALFLIAALVVALVLALGIRWWQRREVRDFERKHPPRRRGPP